MRDVGLPFLLVVAIANLVALGVVVGGRRRRYDIHRHGVVVRGPRGKMEAVIVWARVDPARVLISTSPPRVRAWTPRGLLEWVARPTKVLIHDQRHRPSQSPQGEAHHRYEPKTHDSPCGWWQLDVTDPVHLLTTIEAVMIADGHAARGLTAAALTHRYPAGPATWAAARELERAFNGSHDKLLEDGHETAAGRHKKRRRRS